MGKQLHTTIEIDATPLRVWQVLTDFAAYPEWNPFITRASGAARPGERLHLRMQPPGGRGATLRPTVLEADPGRQLRWLGHVLLPGLSTATTTSPSNRSATVGSASPNRSSSAASWYPLPPSRWTATPSPDSTS
jgi:hypothetical protein